MYFISEFLETICNKIPSFKIGHHILVMKDGNVFVILEPIKEHKVIALFKPGTPFK